MHCPQPVIKCKATLMKLRRGDVLQVVASDRDCIKDIPALVTLLGDELIEVRRINHLLLFRIRRNGQARGRGVRSWRAWLASHLRAPLGLMNAPATLST